jgi:hypothetical protein
MVMMLTPSESIAARRRRNLVRGIALVLAGVLVIAMAIVHTRMERARDDDRSAQDTHGQTGLLWSLNADPTVGPGIAGPLWQLLVRTDVPGIYYKSGASNTAWTLLGSSGGTGNVIGTGDTPHLVRWTGLHTVDDAPSLQDDGTTFAAGPTFAVTLTTGDTTVGALTGSTGVLSGDFQAAGATFTTDGLVVNDGDIGLNSTSFIEVNPTAGAAFSMPNTFNILPADSQFFGQLDLKPAAGPSSASLTFQATHVAIDTSVSGVPALSGCGGGSPVNHGSDIAGRVTEGTTATGCVVTFTSAYAHPPACVVRIEGAVPVTFTYTVSASAITVVNTSATGDVFDYVCINVQ